MPAARLSRVDLPDPDAPMMATRSPRLTVSESWARTPMVRCPTRKPRLTSRKSGAGQSGLSGSCIAAERRLGTNRGLMEHGQAADDSGTPASTCHLTPVQQMRIALHPKLLQE